MAALRTVFLSYAHADRSAALSLAKGLRDQSLDVFIDAESLDPGENWAAHLAEGLGRSDAMVVPLTPKSVASESVRRDIDTHCRLHASSVA